MYLLKNSTHSYLNATSSVSEALPLKQGNNAHYLHFCLTLEWAVWIDEQGRIGKGNQQDRRINKIKAVWVLLWLLSCLRTIASHQDSWRQMLRLLVYARTVHKPCSAELLGTIGGCSSNHLPNTPPSVASPWGAEMDPWPEA